MLIPVVALYIYREDMRTFEVSSKEHQGRNILRYNAESMDLEFVKAV